MIDDTGPVHRHTGLYLTSEKKTGKPQLGVRLKMAVRSHRLKWDPLPANDAGRIVEPVRVGKVSKHGRKGEVI